jgi:exodeoxyribonuclease V alpha subunit
MNAGQLSALACYFGQFVADGCGVDADHPLALSAALVSESNQNGDVCVELKQFANRPMFQFDSDPLLDVPRAPDLNTWRDMLASAAWVGAAGDNTPLILESDRLYLGRYWRDEQQVANALLARMHPLENLHRNRLAEGLQRLFGDNAEMVVNWQKVAAATAASRRFCVISGGPGTGKTTTVVKVLTLLLEQDAGLRIALAAPTGKAAARLSEAIQGGKQYVDAPAGVLERIPVNASTLHRLLGGDGRGHFRHHGNNPMAFDCVVIDEASMIDLPLMARLLDALPAHCRLILLGDRDQLASVEAGNVLGDITGHGAALHHGKSQAALLSELGAVPPGILVSDESVPPISDCISLLRHSYRFSGGSGIAALAGLVNSGDGSAAIDTLTNASNKNDHGDIRWLEAGEQDLNPACLELAVQCYSQFLSQPGEPADLVTALKKLQQFRVLAAVHHGPFGVNELNRRIAAGLHQAGLIHTAHGPPDNTDEYHGKPLMVTVNDYEVGLFNGDNGLLWRDPHGALQACFLEAEDQVRMVPVRQLPTHSCAFALTVHKSQGSEFDRVLLVLPAEENPVVTRELIYTGITRARSHVTVQGRQQTFASACKRRLRRSSALAEKLGWPVLQA